MAKYKVVFSCGHEEQVELLGKVEERVRKIEYFRECGFCSECYKKKKQAEQRIKPTSRIKYAEYKAKDLIYEAIKDTYNADDKTIEVMLNDLYLLKLPEATIQLAIDSKKIVKYIVNNKFSSKDIKETDYYMAYPSFNGKPIEDIVELLGNVRSEIMTFIRIKGSLDNLIASGTVVKCESLEEFMEVNKKRK